MTRKELYPHSYGPSDFHKLNEQRIQFAMELSELIADKNSHVIYVDETSCAIDMA